MMFAIRVWRFHPTLLPPGRGYDITQTKGEKRKARDVKIETPGHSLRKFH